MRARKWVRRGGGGEGIVRWRGPDNGDNREK